MSLFLTPNDATHITSEIMKMKDAGGSINGTSESSFANNKKFTLKYMGAYALDYEPDGKTPIEPSDIYILTIDNNAYTLIYKDGGFTMLKMSQIGGRRRKSYRMRKTQHRRKTQRRRAH